MHLRQEITVLNSRSLDQAPEFTRKLREIGARVVEIPVLEILPLEINERALNVLRQLTNADYVAVTSSNALKALALVLAREPELLRAVNFAVVGEATNELLKRLGRSASLVPKDSSASALGEALFSLTKNSQAKVIFLKGDSAGPNLAYALKELGERYSEITVYSSATSSLLEGRLESEELGGLDLLTFMSSNSALAFFEKIPNKFRQRLLQLPIVAVGPITARTLEELGASQVLIAKDRSIDGVIAAILQLMG